MNKNWILFITLSILAYGWWAYTSFRKQSEYQKQVAAYKEEKAAYEARLAEEQKQKEAMLEAAKKEFAKIAEKVGANPTEATTSSQAAAQVIAAAPESRSLLKRLVNARTAPAQVVDTPLYRVSISELGGRPTSWEIKTSSFVQNVGLPGDTVTTSTVQLVPQVGEAEGREFPFSIYGTTLKQFNDELFKSARRDTPEGTELTFTSDAINGFAVEKKYTFHNETYLVDVELTFRNGAETEKVLGRETGIGFGWQGGFGDPDLGDRVHGLVTPVYASAHEVYSRSVTRTETTFELTKPVDWAGLEKKFFTVLLFPSPENPPMTFRASFNQENDSKEYLIRGTNLPLSATIYHDRKELALNESSTLRYQVYVGPKNLRALAPKGLVQAKEATEPQHVVFHTLPLGLSVLRPFCLLLLGLMRTLNDWIGQWGLAIIATTLVVRALLYPLTHWAIKAQAQTMVEQQKIRPEMDAIMKKYKNDAVKRNQAVMQLYRDHNVHPLGMLRGCVPVLLQTPIFLALYVVFDQSVELRGQPFLWITDLSQPDRLVYWGHELLLIGSAFNLLPLLMGITNYIQMSIMQMPASDELQASIQKQMLIMMPIMIVLFLYQMPSGLILYWIISNIISIGQGYITKRIIASHMAAHEATRKPAQVSA